MFCSQDDRALGYAEQSGEFRGVEIGHGLGLVCFHALCSAPVLDRRSAAPRPSPIGPGWTGNQTAASALPTHRHLTCGTGFTAKTCWLSATFRDASEPLRTTTNGRDNGARDTLNPGGTLCTLQLYGSATSEESASYRGAQRGRTVD